MKRIRIFFICAFLSVLCDNVFAAEASDQQVMEVEGREMRGMAGWRVYISRKLLADAEKPTTERALELMQAQLKRIIMLVPTVALTKLKQVPLFVSPPYEGSRPTAAYHPSKAWLLANNRDPMMAKAVEFTNTRNFEAECRRMPVLVLHELAHAYHDRILGNGHAGIKAAYEAAKASGKYDRVERQDSEGRKRMDRAYALNNPQEYFAETTEAYFAENDFFPYTRDQLKTHDPKMFALLEKLWSSQGDAVLLKKPNILVILADDLGYGDVACYNAKSKVATPNIDRLAQQGMLFTDAHSPATVCTPSRYSLMTGQMAFRVPRGGTVFTGVGGPSLIAPGRLTLPAMLRQQGYVTAAVGKWHVGLTFRDKAGEPIHQGSLEAVRRIDYSRRIEGGPLDHGFDSFYGTACCPGTDWLYAFIDGDRIPMPPVAPIDRGSLPKHPYANDCRGGLIATNFPMEELDMVFLQKSREFLEAHVRQSPEKPFFLYHASHAVHLPSFAASRFKGKTQAGPHGDFIFEFDHIVGELMGVLEKLGVSDNTVVILTSDNGPEVTSVVHMRADYDHDGARPWCGVKRDQWEGGHRVPFIVSWPGKVKPGTTNKQLICLTDIMATAAAITSTGLPEAAAEDSFNLLPTLLDSRAETGRPYLLTQAFGGARTLSIRQGKWKYIDHPGSGGNNYTSKELKPFALPELVKDATGQLYDMEADPAERINLISERPEVAKELKELLNQSKASGRSRPVRSASNSK